MENIIYDNYEYKNIFKVSNNMLLKYSVQYEQSWQYLQKKNFNFINNPIKIINLENDSNNQYNSKIYLPYLNDYKTIYDNIYTKKLNTEEILKLLKRMLLCIKKMHNNKIIHGDITSKNIMINKNLEIVFIDFCQSIINDVVSLENVYLNDNLDDCKKLTIIDDKLDLFETFIYYLLEDKFPDGIIYDYNLKKSLFPQRIYEEIKAYHYGETVPGEDYYFIDIIDDLIDMGYEKSKK